MNILIIFFGKIFSKISVSLNLGHGSTWPGHVALKLNQKFIKQALSQSGTKTILITGTNGKTTTAKLLQTILRDKRILVNYSGANLLNGIASAIILKSNLKGKLKCDYAIFEVDENTLPQIASYIKPDYIIALNLFRDQLDRYGEVNTVAKNWKNAYANLGKTKFILNADDPQIAYLGNDLKSRAFYFGLDDEKYATGIKQEAADSTLCPKCNSNLHFAKNYFSHLGKWECNKCGFIRPNPNLTSFNIYPLVGTYAIYDTLAAVLAAQKIGIRNAQIEQRLKTFTPAFGRQETIEINGKIIKIFLSKNPTSLNESLKTINENDVKNLLIVLNDRIPDGTDVSWIWDVDFENLIKRGVNVYLSGDRVYDLAIRIKYAEVKISDGNIFENLKEAIKTSLENTKVNETLYILPTYSAMLEARKILTGRKIL